MLQVDVKNEAKLQGAFSSSKAIRFVNNQGQPPSKRPRVEAACKTCRKRKTRCSGERPECKTCTKNGHNCLGYGDVVEKKTKTERPAPIICERTPSADLGANVVERYRDRDASDADSEGYDDDDEDAWVHRSSSSSRSVRSGRAQQYGDEWTQSQSQACMHHHRHSYSQHSAYSRDETRKVPYFRYIGPMVPAYKQRVNKKTPANDARKIRGGSSTRWGTAGHAGHSQAHHVGSRVEQKTYDWDDVVYEKNQKNVHPLILQLVETFFLHLGSNFPFLRKEKCLRDITEATLEPILVDSMCALAARFHGPASTNGSRPTSSDCGHVFSRRAKAATLDSLFPCPSIAVVQAYLLMAYESFGADQDSTLWMYHLLAIRMCVELGLGKGSNDEGSDPWYVRGWAHRKIAGPDSDACEQERADTFWAVFILDRITSSGAGQPVCDHDFALKLPEDCALPGSDLNAPFPRLIRIVHLHGRVSDILNKVKNTDDLTAEKLGRLAYLEKDLTKLYAEFPEKLVFHVSNFQEYVKAGQGTTFLLLHFWFHALIIVLHGPTLLPFGSTVKRAPLVQNSRALSMMSAKTIADILRLAHLIDPKSLCGNPFTSQPVYIAACNFLNETNANTSESGDECPARGLGPEAIRNSPSRAKASPGRTPKHWLLASAASRDYQTCYESLQMLRDKWGGVAYMLEALDLKSKNFGQHEPGAGEANLGSSQLRSETLERFTSMENPPSPHVAPLVAVALTGTTNSPCSNLTLMYPNNVAPAPSPGPPSTPSRMFDPIRPGLVLDETQAVFPSLYPQPMPSAVRTQMHPDQAAVGHYNHMGDTKLQILAGVTLQARHDHSLPPSHTPSMHQPHVYNHSSMMHGGPSGHGSSDFTAMHQQYNQYGSLVLGNHRHYNQHAQHSNPSSRNTDNENDCQHLHINDQPIDVYSDWLGPSYVAGDNMYAMSTDVFTQSQDLWIGDVLESESSYRDMFLPRDDLGLLPKDTGTLGS